MNEIKSKEELLKELQNIATKMNSIKSTVEEMLIEFDELEKKYLEISDEIIKN